MRLKQRSGIYANYNNQATFDPATGKGYSYGWWRMIDKIGPFVVKNSYVYSNQTAKHLSKLEYVLGDLDITVDFRLPFPRGINEIDPKHFYHSSRQSMFTVFDFLKDQRETLLKAINGRGTKAKRAERIQLLEIVEMQLAAVTLLARIQKTTGKRRAQAIAKARRLAKALAKHTANAPTRECRTLRNRDRKRKQRELAKARQDDASPEMAVLSLMQGGQNE